MTRAHDHARGTRARRALGEGVERFVGFGARYDLHAEIAHPGHGTVVLAPEQDVTGTTDLLRRDQPVHVDVIEGSAREVGERRVDVLRGQRLE